jgi:hypothetical protein
LEYIFNLSSSFRKEFEMSGMTWGELKEYCERNGVKDSARIMVARVHDESVGFGDDGYEDVHGPRHALGNELIIE